MRDKIAARIAKFQPEPWLWFQLCLVNITLEPPVHAQLSLWRIVKYIEVVALLRASTCVERD